MKYWPKTPVQFFPIFFPFFPFLGVAILHLQKFVSAEKLFQHIFLDVIPNATNHPTDFRALSLFFTIFNLSTSTLANQFHVLNFNNES